MLSPLLRLLMVAIAGSHCTAVTVANAEISEIGAPAGSPSVGRWLDEDDFDDCRSSPDDRSWWDDDESISEDADEDELSHSATAGSASIAEQPALDRVGRVKERRPKRHRLRIWKNKTAKTSHDTYSQDHSEASGTVSKYDEEHPMRTDEWQLDVTLSRLYHSQDGDLFPECFSRGIQSNSKRGPLKRRQVFQFATNGYVKILGDASNAANQKTVNAKVGKWKMGHSGVAFDVPIHLLGTNSRKEKHRRLPKFTVLHYHADIHLNKFGERPRMFKGVITRDRHASFLPPNFLRPVIGTFKAEGIGHDTVDTSYKERASTLSRQQVINDALANKRE